MEKDKLETVVDELNVVLKKYDFQGLIICFGMENRAEIVDEAVLVTGETEYLSQLLATCIQRNPKLRQVVDNVALAVAIKKDTDN